MISVTQDNQVCILSMDRPEKKNAITQNMYQQLADAINQCTGDSVTKVIVLTGEGDNFTSGNDLADFLSNPDMSEESSVYQFLQALITCPLPVVAAVKGFVIGIGATLLLHCEQVFADSSASIAFPFVNLGLVPEAGSSLLLPRQVGYQKAADLLLTGDVISADDAHKIGLVAQLVGDGADVQELALIYAHKLAAKPRATLIKIKSLLNADMDRLNACVEAELVLFKQSLNSPEAKEVMSAFLEKRTPNFDNL